MTHSPLLTSEFDFELPPELVPSRPQRGSSRLMEVTPHNGHTHHQFADLPQLLRAGDLLVLNDTKVLKARLRGRRINARSQRGASTAQAEGGKVEALMIEPTASAQATHSGATWLAMLKPGKRQRPGQQIQLADRKARVLDRQGDLFILQFEATESELLESIERHGELPLPPYLGRTADERDNVDYQTVYAEAPGAVAAPTAGLHFEEASLDELHKHGVDTARVTLHVGPGTFRPVKTNDVRAHRMDEERYVVSEQAATKIARTRRDAGRVIAVGTTVTRTLEAAVLQPEGLAGSGRTDLFIVPGYKFKVIDGLITNFHLPRSTLLMLVSAFVGREQTLSAYAEAVKQRYRFYSYGDAMLVWPSKES